MKIAVIGFAINFVAWAAVSGIAIDGNYRMRNAIKDIDLRADRSEYNYRLAEEHEIPHWPSKEEWLSEATAYRQCLTILKGDPT